MEQLNDLQKQLDATDNFLDAMELQSQIDDLKIKLGLMVAKVCSIDNPECLTCGS